MSTRSLPHRSTPLLSAAAVAFASLGLVGCGSEPEEVAYCTAADGTIVDEDYCDEDGDGHGGFYYLNHGHHSSGLRPGHKLSGGTKIRASDPKARQAAGFSSSGKVVTGRSGGFGTGNSSKSGGFGVKSGGGGGGGGGRGGSSGG